MEDSFDKIDFGSPKKANNIEADLNLENKKNNGKSPKEKKEIKSEKIVSQIDILKEREKKLLERRTQVLRLYLLENIVPELSKGLIEVAREMPDDPIVYLSDYLMRKSKEILNLSRHSDNLK